MKNKLLVLTIFFALTTAQISAQNTVCPHDDYNQCDNCCHMAESRQLESSESDFERSKENCAIRITVSMSDILGRSFPDVGQMFNEVTSSPEFRACIQEAQDDRATRKREISDQYNDCRIECCGLYPDC